LGLPFIATGIFFDKSQSLRKFMVKRGGVVSKVGGALLIVIGILQLSGIWAELMISLRSLISDFVPVI
jgi:cytochrome c-type biogenesis protein